MPTFKTVMKKHLSEEEFLRSSDLLSSNLTKAGTLSPWVLSVAIVVVVVGLLHC